MQNKVLVGGSVLYETRTLFWPPSSEETIKNFFQAVKSFMEKSQSYVCEQ